MILETGLIRVHNTGDSDPLNHLKQFRLKKKSWFSKDCSLYTPENLLTNLLGGHNPSSEELVFGN